MKENSKIVFIFLVEIYQREKKYIEWMEVKAIEYGVETFKIFKDDFYHNIPHFTKKFSGCKVFIFDKSYQSYMWRKFRILKKIGFCLVLRDEEFLVRLNAGLSADRYSKKNALLADAITVWGDEERDLLIKDGITSEKIFFGNAVRYNYESKLNIFYKEYQYIMISSFGDLFPVSGVVHRDPNYVRHLKDSLINVSELLIKLRRLNCRGKIRFHPFEDYTKTINSLSNLGVIFDDLIQIEHPKEVSLEKSLAESKIIIHIGSTIAFDYFFMTNGLKTFMLPRSNQAVYGPEKISITMSIDQLCGLICSGSYIGERCIEKNNYIHMPSENYAEKIIDYILKLDFYIQSEKLSRYFMVINWLLKLVRKIRRATISKKRFEAADIKRNSILSFKIPNYYIIDNGQIPF